MYKQALNSGAAGNSGHAESAMVLWIPGAADAGHLQPLVPDVCHDGLGGDHSQGGIPSCTLKCVSAFLLW